MVAPEFVKTRGQLNGISILFLLSFVTLLSFEGKASAGFCESIFSSQYFLQGRLEVLASAQKDLPSEAYVKVVHTVDQLLGTLDVPKQVPLVITDAFNSTGFHFQTMSASIGLWPQHIVAKSPVVNMHTLAHEYGHAVFEVNLLKRMPLYKNFKKEFIVQDPKLREQKKKDPALAQQWRFVLSLHEFFSDATALMVFKDPKVIRQVLQDPRRQYSSLSIEELSLRDFSQGSDPRAYGRWKETAPLVQDVYYDLLPARWELWKILEPRLAEPGFENQVLPRIFKVLEKQYWDFLVRRNDIPEYGSESALIERNRQLIKALQEALAEHL